MVTVRKLKSNLKFGAAAAELFASREMAGVANGWVEVDDDDNGGGEGEGAAVSEGHTAKWTPLKGSGEGKVVYMDFAQGRHTWGVAQHRAVESVLTRYPEAKIVVLQVGPGG